METGERETCEKGTEDVSIEQSEEKASEPDKCENVENVEEPEKKSDGISALDCFGWKEEKTEKWLKKCAKVWFLIMSLLYFLFGALTFAPIIFVQSKIKSVIKDKKLSYVVSGVLYAAIVTLFCLLVGSRCASKPIA